MNYRGFFHVLCHYITFGNICQVLCLTRLPYTIWNLRRLWELRSKQLLILIPALQYITICLDKLLLYILPFFQLLLISVLIFGVYRAIRETLVFTNLSLVVSLLLFKVIYSWGFFFCPSVIGFGGVVTPSKYVVWISLQLGWYKPPAIASESRGYFSGEVLTVMLDF